MNKGHPILYAVLGFLTAWPGGAVGGYLYATTAREINALRGVPDESLWHNPFFATCIGAIFSPISGAIYGYSYGKKEVELANLKVEIRQSQPRMERDYSGDYDPAREREAEYWRSRAASQDQAPYQGRTS
jgi:hypothetical protein